jgi:hypothetical protein
MKFKDLNPTVIELPSPYVFYRTQLIRPRADSLQMNGVSMPPVGLTPSTYMRRFIPDRYQATEQARNAATR